MKNENIWNFKLVPEQFRFKQLHTDKVGLNRCSGMLCLKRFKEGGIENTLFDVLGRGRNEEITDEEKAWIINIACQNQLILDMLLKFGHTQS